MPADRKPLSGNGKTRDLGFREPADHASRAAELLAKARASSTNNGTPAPSPRTAASARSSPSSDAVPLPALIKSLANPQLGADAMAIKEAIPIAGKLARAKLNTPDKLALLNSLLLEDAGISSEKDRHKTLIAFGVRKVGSSKDVEKKEAKSALSVLSAKSSKPSSGKKKLLDDEALSREYGNITASLNEPGEGDKMEYLFHEVLEEDQIKHRRAVINRAPIMTAWATILLEKLGFLRREALSLAHCYVNTTSTARGISLGIIPASERQRAVNAVGSNQPHFELMGVKIPLMKAGKAQEWRGISEGQIVPPDRAFQYMRNSMRQTLPVIIGSLMLLADSYTSSSSTGPDGIELYQADTVPDTLHAHAYELYTQFRPSTAGEWGKKSTFYCGKALALRRGREEEVSFWEQLEDGEQAIPSQVQDFERELQDFEEDMKRDVKEDGSDPPLGVLRVKQEAVEE